ncbi:MAG: nitroreductase family protein [Bacteroidales bacterium]|jgi:nitroreductase|nr:nitroreductase family protein [Bacteroidales bacterium]
MNEHLIDTLLNRRTIRKYSNKIIDDKTIATILEAGIRSSNCGNMQIYSIIVTRDEQRKKELAKFHFNQSMVSEAPVVLTICADVNRFAKWCKKRNAVTDAYSNFLWFNIGTVDATIVTQTMCIAAEAMGLGICYLGTVTYMAKEIADFLKLPKGVIPITTITMGYPAENPLLTERLAVNAVVHNETYKDYTEEDIEQIYGEFEQLPQSVEYVKENQQQNLAQVFTNCRYKKDDSLLFGRNYFKFIKEQGFLDE